MVFYRKYRPQTIDDLDSASVRDTLHAVLQKDIPHAFLFTGPKGLGKTSTARIVAKVVNCEARKKGVVEPCNECDQCRSITNGTNVDVLEIDAASNRGIDEIRELKEKIRLAPVAAKRKVYIIDEVHMLTTEAFNALLKTLEEPPDHAMFILCTTEAHKVPETIVSRCFQIMFRPATEEELVRSFKRIVKGEKIAIDDEALQLIASMADGGFRDGVKILEEISLFSNGVSITKEFIEKHNNTTGVSLDVNEFLNALSKGHKKNAVDALRIIDTVTKQGLSSKYFIEQILLRLHQALQNKMGLAKYPVNLADFEVEDISKLTTLFSKAYQDTKYAVLPQLPLELAVIEWCEEKSSPEKHTDPAPVADSGPSVAAKKSYVAEDTEVSVSSLRKQVGNMKKIKALYGDKAAKPVATEETEVTTTTVELMHTNGDGTITNEWLDHFWRNLITEMKLHNHTVAGVLRGCTIKSFADQKLVIQTAYKFHKERLDDMKNREALLKISKLLTGKDVTIEVELRK